MDSGASDEDLEDFQAGSAFCRVAITFLHVAASVSGGRSHFFCIGNKILNHLVAGIGVVGPGGSCCHSHLLLPGLLFIQTTQYIFVVFLISNFSLKSSYLQLLII